MKNSPAGGSARGLLQSPCYWLGARDPIDLRWEFVIPFTSGDTHPEDVRVAGCHRYIGEGRASDDPQSGFEPFTRRSALDPDTKEPVNYTGNIVTWLQADVDLQRQIAGFEYPAPDGIDCFEPSAGPGMSEEEIPILTCTNFAGGSPICNPFGCEVLASTAPKPDGHQARDVVFRARVETPDHLEIAPDGTMSSDAPRMRSFNRLAGPVYRIVETSRVFRAKLELDVTRSLTDDELVYRWAMPTVTIGGKQVPRANFHPSLDSNVRFFVVRDGRVVPLSPKRVLAFRGGAGTPTVNCVPDERRSRSHDQLRACRNGLAYERLNAVSWPHPLRGGDDPFSWEVTFDYKEDPLSYGPGAYSEELLAPDGDVFMEFTLFEPSYSFTSAHAFRLTPSHIQLGDTVASRAKTSLGWFENLTGNVVRILGASFDDGRNFSLSPMTFPVDVGPGASLQFEVSVRPGGLTGATEDTLRFEIKSHIGSSPLEFRTARVSAYAVPGAIAAVAPESVTLWVQPGEPTEHQRDVRRILFENRGTHPFTREPVVLGGQDPSAFTISATSTDPTDDPNISATLTPGTSSVFEVAFTPQHPGTHHAEVHLKHDAENGPEHIIELTGVAP